MVSGVMPCSALYAPWIARRRWVSSIALRIALDCLSAYMSTLPFDVAGRPADGLDQRGLPAQEALLVGVEDRHQRDLGQVEPFAQQVHPDQHVELAEAQLADDLDPLERVDVRVQVADPEADFVQVVGQVLAIFFVERGDQDALVAIGRQRISGSRSSIWVRVSRSSTSGSTSPVGLTICSTIGRM